MKILWLTILLFPSFANARILFEPYIGYNVTGTLSGGALMTSGFGTNTNKANFSNSQFGARLAWTNLSLQFGVEYNLVNTGKLKITPEIQDYTPSTTSKHLGGFIAYSFAKPIQIIGTYFFQNTLKLNADYEKYGYLTTATDELTGTGYKIAAFYHLYSHLNIGIEYLQINYNSFTQTLTGLDIVEKSTGVVKAGTDHSIFLAIAIPFST